MKRKNNILIILNFKSSKSQPITNNLLLADSLYNSKKYTESLKIYESTLEETKQISPKILLKMARINEGVKKNPEALYYLSLYYKTLKDETVIPKTITIAEKNNYDGWEYNDINFIENVFQIYIQNYLLNNL